MLRRLAAIVAAALAVLLIAVLGRQHPEPIVPGDRGEVEAPGPASPRPAELEAEAAGRAGMRIVVLADVDGSPVEGATVRLRRLGSDESATATSDADGCVTFPAAPDRLHAVEVDPLWNRTPPLAGQSRGVRGHGRHEIRLPRPWILGVRVVDEGGRPLDEPLDVAARRVGGSGWVTPLETGPRGAGRERLVLSPGEWRVLVRPEAAGSSRVSESRIVRPGTDEVVLTLRRGEPLRFRLVDPKSRREPSGTVIYRITPSGESFTPTGTSGHGWTRGEPFVSRALRPGSYDVILFLYVLYAQSPGPLIGFGEARGVLAGAEPTTIEVQSGGRLSGRVLGADGQPMADILSNLVVSLDLPEESIHVAYARLAADGSFAVRGLPPGPLRIDYEGLEGWAEPIQGLVPNVEGLTVSTRPTVTVSGRVIAEGWRGDYGGHVHAAPGNRTFVAADGRFALNGLRPGPVRLTWRIHGAILADLGEVVAPAEGVVLRARLR